MNRLKEIVSEKTDLKTILGILKEQHNVKGKALFMNFLNPLEKLFLSSLLAKVVTCLIECKKQK